MIPKLTSLWLPVVTAGVAAGTVDVGAACLIYQVSPFIILQAIAGGLLGSETFSMGGSSAILGLALQWAMSIVIAGCCTLATERLATLRRHWIVAGLVYGSVTFLVMNGLVVPLSASSTKPHLTWPWFVKNLLAMWVFGLIVTAITSRWRRTTPARGSNRSGSSQDSS